MDKKDAFKLFIKNHPEIVEYVKSKKMTFQDFYEIYDIYGEDTSVWDKYFNRSEKDTKDKIGELTSIVKGINLDSVEHHIDNAKKAIGIIQELTKKNPEVITKIERPITKFYGD